MKKLLITLCMLMFTMATLASISPRGQWTTIDDRTKAPRALVTIRDKGGVVSARIVRVYKQEGDKGYCLKCPKPFKNKPIDGLRFIWGMKKQSDTVWSEGHILDPKSGKIYRCKMTISNDGKKIWVRGYIGIPLLGRTQEWFRRA